MGCHTWFYKKVKNQPTEQDKIEQFKYKTQQRLNKLQTAVKNGGFEYSDEKLTWYPFEDEVEVHNTIGITKWMLENANNYKAFENSKFETKEFELYCSVEAWKAPIDEDSKGIWNGEDELDNLTTCHNGVYYSSVRRYGDCFRYYEYDTYVSSKEETFKLIEDNHIKITQGVREKIEEFWSLYPDGFIQFS